jgi:hypothetical protein
MTPDEIAADLQRRGCKLYHAINLPDFQTYAKREALLSRSQLERSETGIGTPFASDATDTERGLMDRCFGNLSDFGSAFWAFQTAAPNAYGPISLVFSKNVFQLTSDAAVTEKNAIKEDYDLAKDRVSDATLWQSFFEKDDKPWLAKGHRFLEFSTSTSLLPFEYLEKVIVEPLEFDEIKLIDLVRPLLMPSVLVEERAASPLGGQVLILNGLAEWAARRGGTPPGPMDLGDAPAGVARWWRALPPKARKATFRWFQYIVSTLKEMNADAVAEPAPPPPFCDSCDRYATIRCSGCLRWMCREDYQGSTDDQKFDTNNQNRCWECCFDPT